MHRNIKGITLIAITLITTTACTPVKKRGVPPPRELTSCTAEASALVKINRGKYEKYYTRLSSAIKMTQDYSVVIANIRLNSQSIITPLYQYKINEICNEISQKLLAELTGKALEIQSQ